VPDVDAHDVVALQNAVSYWLHAVEGYFPEAEIKVQAGEQIVYSLGARRTWDF
jgi:hypothetical protein